MYPLPVGKVMVAVNAFVPDTEQTVETFHTREYDLVASQPAFSGGHPLGNTPQVWNASQRAHANTFSVASANKATVAIVDEIPWDGVNGATHVEENAFNVYLNGAVLQYATA